MDIEKSPSSFREGIRIPSPIPEAHGTGSDIIKQIWGRKTESYRGRSRSLSEAYETVNALWDESITPTNRQLIPSDQLTDSDRLLLILRNSFILRRINWDKQKLYTEIYNHFLKK
jgi:hypothetical protein